MNVPETLYHGTLKRNLPSIRLHGLIPNYSRQWGCSGNFVYLGNRFIASYYSGGWFGDKNIVPDNSVILCISTNKLELPLLRPDVHYYKNCDLPMDIESWQYHGVVHPSAIYET